MQGDESMFSKNPKLFLSDAKFCVNGALKAMLITMCTQSEVVGLEIQLVGCSSLNSPTGK